ncbi:MAG: biotin--[acetyl-CoA-carboxylase] ligase [Acidobacteriota bacterium]|nr:biotin--[acetyl-CoA-carboxylase] ligase [Acidobacteriota bacterium]
MKLDLPYIRTQLANREIHHHESIPSTMPEAIRLAAEGAPTGSAVIADEQTAGHGRYGRTWHSEPNSGLYVSVILRFKFTPEQLPVTTLALGLAVTEAIQQAANITCDLRWPNDVLIADKKCAGILTQTEGAAVIAGIGINVNHTSFPAELASHATSLRIASGREQSREKLLIAMLPAIDFYCALLAGKGREPILDMFSHASSYVSGRRVTVDQGDSILSGTTAGLNESGFLLLQRDDGRQNLIIAGGVRPCS